MNFGFWKILELLGELSSLKMLEKPDYCLFFCVNGVPFARWKIIARDFTPMVSLYFLATELQHVWYATTFEFFGTVANQTTHQIVLCQNKRWRTLISVLRLKKGDFHCCTRTTTRTAAACLQNIPVGNNASLTRRCGPVWFLNTRAPWQSACIIWSKWDQNSSGWLL